MSLSKSIFSLTKNNNGFFKSEKQKDFLTKVLLENDFIGHASSGYNSCPLHAKFDDKGITEVFKIRFKKGKGYSKDIVFTRQTKQQLIEENSMYVREHNRIVLESELEISEIESKMKKEYDRFNECLKGMSADYVKMYTDMYNNHSKYDRDRLTFLKNEIKHSLKRIDELGFTNKPYIS